MSAAHGQDSHKVESDGYRWFFGMGLLALVFCFVLKTVDDKLSTSDSEKRLGQTLHELRTAQASLPARVTDSRQTLPFMHSHQANEQVSEQSAEAHH